MSALPILKDEIDRKSFETIDWLATAFDHGKLTNAQYATGLEALFMAVSGLVDNEIFELISVASGIAGRALSVEKRVFLKGDLLICLTWAGGQEEFHVATFARGIVTSSKTKYCDTVKEAKVAFDEKAKKVLEMGFAEL